MPDQATQKKEAAPDVRPEKAAGGLSATEGSGAVAAIPALIRPSLGFGGGRIPPATVVALQRRAGNRAVASLVVQRDNYRPPLPPDEELIAEAIKDRDQAKIKTVRDLAKAKFADKISMIDILTDQFWVGPQDEYALEKLWGSFGETVLDVASKNAGLWEKSLKGGAELYNLPAVKPIAQQFLADTRAIAGGFLDTNEKYAVAELGRLGVMEGGAAAPSDAEQAARQTELTAAIRLAKESTDAQAQLRTVTVALERRYNMMTDSQLYFSSGFDPQHQPAPDDENPPPDRIEKAKAKGMTDAQLARTPWKNVKAQWDVLEAILQGLAIAYPAVGIALTSPKGMATAGGEDPKAAKAAIVSMLTGARDAIRETRPKLAGGLAYELTPIHSQLFGGTKGASGTDWKDPVRQVVAKEVLELKSNVEFWKSMGVATLAAAAFILAEFATAGLATAALVGFGVGLGAGQAVVAWEKALEMQTAEKATTGGGTELLASGQASMATFEAALATVMVFVDAFMAAKPLGKALSGAVDRASLLAGTKAATKIGEELAGLAGKAPDRALVERAITELGAEQVIAKTGKSATELIAIVGDNSSVAARLKALAAIPADLMKLTMPELAKRARQLAVEISTNRETGEAIAALAVERFGPKKVLDMNGGWKNLSLGLGNESAAGKSIMAWRDAAMGDIEAFVKTLPGGVDETGKAAVKRTGSQGKFTNDFDVSLLGAHASANRNATRAFAAGRFGTAVDRLNELLLADFFTDPRRLHLYDTLDPLLRAEVGQRAEKVAEATIFSKTLHDAEEAGNKELAHQIRDQMKALNVEEVPFKPLSEVDRSALYTKLDDYHVQLEQALANADKAAQKDLVAKIGDTQGLVNATEGGGYFSGGATRQIVTLAEGLLKGSTKPLDAQVYTALLDQLPKLNEAASSLLKTGVTAGEDAVASIKGIAKYGNRFRELMAKMEVKVADEGAWNALAERLQKLLKEAKGEADVTLLSRLETDAKSVETEVNGLMAEFRASSSNVLMTLSRQSALSGAKVDLNAIQFLVMATAKLTRTSAAMRESLHLIVAQMAEAALAAAKTPGQTTDTPAPATTPPPAAPAKPAGPSPGTGGPAAPAQRLHVQRTAAGRPALVPRPMPTGSAVAQRAPAPNEWKPTAAGTDVDEAIKAKDKSKLKGIDNFPKLSFDQLSKIVDIILDTWVVGSFDIRTLEAAWRAYRPNDPASLSDADVALWKKCTSGRGSGLEVSPKNVPWIAELRSSFAEAARFMAYDNLEKNEDYLKKEAVSLGIQLPGEPAPPAQTAVPETTHEQRITDRQKVAREILDLKKARESLLTIEVGYQPAADPRAPAPAPTSAPISMGLPRAKFVPGTPPAQPPTGHEDGSGQRAMPQHAEVQAIYDSVTAGIKRRANSSAAVYSMLSGGSLEDFAKAEGAEARQKLEANLRGSLEGIKKTRLNLQPPNPALGFENLMPVHERLFSGGEKPVWTKPFPKALAKDYIADEHGNEAKLAALMGVAALILTVVSFGTGAAAIAALATVIGAVSSATAAAGSIQQASAVGGAAKAGQSDDLALVTAEQAESAQTEAVINTALAFIDLYGVAKGVRALGAARASVAGFRAAEEASQLAKLSKLSAAEQSTAIASAIDRQGVAAVVARTGQTPEQLLKIVGKESPAAARITTYVEAVAKGGAQAIKDVVPQLAKVAELPAKEAEAAVAHAFDLLGPARTVELGGGFAKIQKAVGAEAPSMRRLSGWRNEIRDDLAGFLAERRAGSAATGTGKEVASARGPMVSSPAQAAEEVQAARSFAASRSGIGTSKVDGVLELGLATPEQLEKFILQVHPIAGAGFARLTAIEKAAVLTGNINQRLAELGLPEAVYRLGSGNRPHFDWKTWSITYPESILQKTVYSAEDLKYLKEMTLHEARHAEQGYQAARFMAGEGKDAKWIEQSMHVQDKAAKKAFANPMKKDDPAYANAEEWYQSIWGNKSEWRESVFKNMDRTEKELLMIESQARAAVADLEATPLARRNPQRALALEAKAKELNAENKKWTEAYEKLPEERDAYGTQARLRQKLVEHEQAMKELEEKLRGASPATQPKPAVGTASAPDTLPSPPPVTQPFP